MSEERIGLFDHIGFTWQLKTTPPPSWEELKAYKLVNGNCNVPKDYPANPSLGSWVENNNRQKIKKKKLSEERIQQLNDIGLAWSPYHKNAGRIIVEISLPSKKSAPIGRSAKNARNIPIWRDG